jgi:uncharacterized RDD family membrane protein YckC
VPPPAAPPPAPDVVPAPYRPRITHLPSYLASRFAAFVLDVFGVAFLLATFGYHAANLGTWAGVKADASGFWIISLTAFVLALLIAFVCEGLFATTLGKLLFGLVVLNARGGYAGLGRALTRSAMRPVDLLLIGPILALATPKRQRLGDLMAGTVVSQTRFAPLMTLIAGVAIGALVYAQFSFGGGADSAIGVVAQSLAAGSDLATRFRATQSNLPVANPSPLVSLPATPAASAAPSEPPPTEVPSAQPSPSDEPAATAVPEATPAPVMTS